MAIDERGVNDLIAESDDLHSDAMRATRDSLDELTDTTASNPASRDRDVIDAFAGRRTDLLAGAALAGGMLATGGLLAAVLRLFEGTAFADQSTDVQMLQTAASLENLAVATYGTALGLDFIGGSKANPVVKAFVMKTRAQHKDHADAFNAAAASAGGKKQMNPDPVLLGVVNSAKPTLTTPAAVVGLAIQLEMGAAETYVASTGAASDVSARQVFASVMGVEAQHVAILMAVQALLAGGAPQLIALPPDLAKLPAAAGNIGFPDSFYKTDMARPASEGAVK
ncbi:MAG TPA: ferritin-like domain-containing protein [Acidimicrobiia bacterium]